MERITKLVFVVNLLILFISVVDQARADTCVDGLGTCENCDARCKAKHGPTSQGSCDHSVGVALCKCNYQCGQAPPAPPGKPKCQGAAGLCSQQCPGNCCDLKCAQKYVGGHGFCNSLGTSNFCQCEYPC